MARGKEKEKHVLLRLPPELHEQLVAMAAEEHRSINSEIVMHLLEAAHRAESIKQLALAGTRRGYTKEELREMGKQIRMLKEADRLMRKKLGWPKKK